MSEISQQVAANIAAIERGLATIPLGATIREEIERPAAPRKAESTGVEYAPPAEGSYLCRLDCGNVTPRPGVCSTCAARAARADALEFFAPSLDSIPETFRWAAPGHPELIRRASPVSASGAPFSPRELAEGMAWALLGGERLAYVLWGPTESGKTSVACAAARAIIDAAIAAMVTQAWQPPADRLAPVPALPLVVRIAGAVRFVRTIDLVPPRDRGADDEPPAYGLAQRASILILDDGSKESSRSDSWSDSARALATVEVIAKRWDRGRPTIFTTFQDARGVGERYDGGTRRRLFDDKRSRAIEFRCLGGASK